MRRDDEHPLLLDTTEVIDWPTLCSALTAHSSNGGPSPAKRIMQLLPAEIQQTISSSQTTDTEESNKSRFVGALNELLTKPDFYQPEDFQSLTLSDEVLALLNRKRSELSQNELEWLNRLLLETAFPRQISKFELYPGPRSFQKEQRNFFFGRKREANELVALVTAHPIVLFYSQSGAGKTSLLNARFIPLLEEKESFTVLGPLRVQGEIPAGAKVSKEANVYVLNALMSCLCDRANSSKLSGMTFAKFLEEKKVRLNEYGEPCPTVIIFDQFEELFTSYPGRWEDRKRFFEQIRDALEGNESLGTKGDPLLRIVFSMREDYIAELHPYASLLPEKLQTRFRLEQLGEEAALLAIKEPLAKIGRTYAPGVAEKLAKNLLKIPDQNTGEPAKFGMYIEPLQLQIVCQSLWQALKPGEKSITFKHLQKYGKVSQALSNFYERSIKTVAEETGVKEEALRTWFGETLITAEGVRAPVYRRERETGGLPNVAVDKLETIRLIKAESKGINVRWYELAHDRFIEPIRRSNEKWLADQSRTDQKRRRLELRAAKWRQGSAGLLEADELAEAKRLLKHWDGASESLGALVDASGAFAQRRTLKLYGLGVAVLLAMVLVMAGLAYYAWQQGKAAGKNEGIAKSRLIATKADIELNSDPERAVLLVKEALDQFPHTEEAEAVLRTGLLSLSDGRGVLRQDKGRMRSAVFSPDGQYILTSSDVGSAKLWNASTKTVVSELGGEQDKETYATFSPSGQLIVTTGSGGIARVWDGSSGQFLRDLRGHADFAARPIFSPDDKLIIAPSDDNTLGIWNASTGEKVNVLRGHEDEIHEIAISSDGTHIAAEAADETARIWDVSSGKAVTLTGLSGPKPAIAFSPNGKLLATEGGPKTEGGIDAISNLYPVTVWNAVTGKPKFKLAGHRNAITSITFSPDGRYIVTASNDGTAQVWAVEANGVSTAQLADRTQAAAILRAVFSPDGRFIVTASADNTARVWDLKGQSVAWLRGHSGAVNSAVFSADAKVVLTASDDMTARIWEWNATRNQVLNAHIGGANSAAFSTNGNFIITAGFDRKARLWNVSSNNLLAQLEGHTDSIVNVALSPDGKFVVTSSFDKTARIWSLDTSQVFVYYNGDYYRAQNVNGKYVINAVLDRSLRVWKLDTSQKEISLSANVLPMRSLIFADQVLVGHSGHVNKAAFSPDSKRIITASSDGTARVWDSSTGQSLKELHVYDSKVNSAEFSPDGKFIVTASDDGAVRIWDAENYALIRALGQQTQPVYSAGYSPDGKLIVTSGADTIARVWDSVTGNQVVALNGHKDEIKSASFSPDGKMIVTSSDDKSIRVWETRTWRTITPLHGHTGKVFSAAFSPDGKLIVTASADGTVRIYPPQAFATLDELRRLIPKRVTRSLTKEEHETFFGALSQ